MLKSFFKKKFTNENFIIELFQDRPNFGWLDESISSNLINIDYQDENQNTFLMTSIKRNKVKAALWLLENNANPTIPDSNNQTTINLAIDKNKISIVEGLLKDKRVNVDQKDAYGRSLLQNLIISGNHKIAEMLIEIGADINALDNKGKHILYDALSYGEPLFINHLLTHENLELNDIDEDGDTIMQHPQIVQNDRLAKQLLVAGANPTVTNSKGESFLFKTVLRGVEGEDIVNTALLYGADVNVRTLNGNTIMMELIIQASKMGKDNLAKKTSIMNSVTKMLDYGGEINALDSNGESGLFNAVNIRDIKLITFLLKSYIDPNIQNKKGETVLEYLVYDAMVYSEIIKLLLKYNIDPKLTNKKGQTIYEVLTNIILHIDEAILIKDKHLVSLINPDGIYMNVVQLILKNEQLRAEEKATAEAEENDEEVDLKRIIILNILDSTGDPLFFKPLINDNFALFNIYTKYKINIHQLNKQKYNIFYAYVLRIFENDQSTSIVCKNFQNNLSSLLSRKVDKDFKDSLGWTILHKVIGTNCNIKLFNILTKVVHFDYFAIDELGRNVIHNAVWHNKSEVIRIVGKLSPKTLNMVDKYGIPPVYYAALLGSKTLVLQFIDLGVNVTINGKINLKAIKKFSPMLKNIYTLKADTKDLSILQKFDNLIEQVEVKFLKK